MTAFQKAEAVIDDLGYKLKIVFNSVEGQVMAFLTFIAITFGEKAYLFNWVLVALFIDLCFGCWSSWILGKFKISILLYSTAVKFVMYLVLFFMPVILEKVLSNNGVGVGTTLVAAILIAAEFFSTCAHMLIIKPDLPAVKLLKKVLVGEIAHKLGIESSEVEEFFANNEKRNENKQ